MKVIQIVFSPTGGTQKVADTVAASFRLPVEKIDLCSPAAPQTEIAPEDVVLIAVPSYGGRVPAIAAERLSQLKGGSAVCVLICVYGNRAYEDTLAEMQDIAAACGFRVCAAIAAIAEHSILRQYAAGRPDQQDIQELRGYSDQILAKIRSGGEALPCTALPGNRPYKKAGGGGMVPKAGNACTNCGICADTCPVQAIAKESPRTADAKKCISCMRCVAVCPHAARSVNKTMLTAAALKLKKACSERKENELFL